MHHNPKAIEEHNIRHKLSEELSHGRATLSASRRAMNEEWTESKYPSLSVAAIA
jgi:hypothetical protein